MKIIIAGAGDMGTHLAKMLSGNGHDISVADVDPRALEEVGGLVDVETIEGDTTQFSVLKKAGVRKCDLFIAVRSVENDNILSAVMAKQLGARKAIARIDSSEYLEPNSKEIFIDMGIDYLFYPEHIAAREVINLLGHSSTTEYVDFAAGKLSLLAFKLELTSPLLGQKVVDMENMDEDVAYRTVAIVRNSQTIIPTSEHRYEDEDMVYIIARHNAASDIVELSGNSQVDIRDMMILGGSRIGVRIAKELQNRVNIKLVDYNAEKAVMLSKMLDKALIINEDGRDTEAMLEENISGMDAFVAVTGRSETNILAAMLAKRMGVKKVIAEVENINYISLAESMGVNTIINKKLVTASNIFRFTMTTDVQAIKCLTGSQAEVLEFIVKPNSPATKAMVKDLRLPQDVIIGGVVRGDKAFIAVGDTTMKAYDRVVVFSMPESIAKVGEYFN